MRKSALLGVSLTLALLGATHGVAVADSVCYEFDEGGSVLVLDVKAHSALTTTREAEEAGAPRQTTYSAHGKVIFGGEALFAQGATITVGRGVGAALSLYGGPDCFSNRGSPKPKEWQCPFVNEEEEVELFTFTKVDPSINKLCNVFFVPDFNNGSIASGSSGSHSHWGR